MEGTTRARWAADDDTGERAVARAGAGHPRRSPAATAGPEPWAAAARSSGLTTEQVIKAAQTPDGAAIPQPSCPNHTCPEVVVRLGFWSCPTIGDTCSSGGRSCLCQRTDGEGQFPSWVCN